MGCNRPSDRGCSGRLDDDLSHRQRTQGTLMSSTAQGLQLFVASQTVQEFNQLVDEVANGKSRQPGRK